MRKPNLFGGFALLAILAGSITTAGQAQAKNDFDALLADVSFGGAAAIDEAASQSAPDAAKFSSTPAATAMTMPESLPVPSVTQQAVVDYPIAQPMIADSASVGTDCGGQCDGQCGGKCGGKCGLKRHHRITPGYCQPYTPPQLPTSTFYQYWRSNPCHVNVWDGFRNRCHPNIDLSIHHRGKNSCGTGQCDSGCSTGCGDCGPAPAEWFAKGKCATGAGCDGH